MSFEVKADIVKHFAGYGKTWRDIVLAEEDTFKKMVKEDIGPDAPASLGALVERMKRREQNVPVYVWLLLSVSDTAWFTKCVIHAAIWALLPLTYDFDTPSNKSMNLSEARKAIWVFTGKRPKIEGDYIQIAEDVQPEKCMRMEALRGSGYKVIEDDLFVYYADAVLVAVGSIADQLVTEFYLLKRRYRVQPLPEMTSKRMGLSEIKKTNLNPYRFMARRQFTPLVHMKYDQRVAVPPCIKSIIGDLAAFAREADYEHLSLWVRFVKKYTGDMIADLNKSDYNSWFADLVAELHPEDADSLRDEFLAFSPREKLWDFSCGAMSAYCPYNNQEKPVETDIEDVAGKEEKEAESNKKVKITENVTDRQKKCKEQTKKKTKLKFYSPTTAIVWGG